MPGQYSRGRRRGQARYLIRSAGHRSLGATPALMPGPNAGVGRERAYYAAGGAPPCGVTLPCATHAWVNMRTRPQKHPQLVDMEVIVRRQDQKHCASITCMIRHYVARRATVIFDHPHNAA
jgi:hypothetical protein